MFGIVLPAQLTSLPWELTAFFIIDFVLVELQLLTALFHEGVCSRYSLLTLLAIASEAFVLSPFFFQNDADTAAALYTILGTFLVQLCVYLFSFLKVSKIATRMVEFGRLAGSNLWVLWISGLFIAASAFFSDRVPWLSWLSVLGVIMYLIVLNRIRHAGGPVSTRRMLFALMLMLFFLLIATVLMIVVFAKAQFTGTETWQQVSQKLYDQYGNYVYVSLLFFLLYKLLLVRLTGYVLGDVCGVPKDLDEMAYIPINQPAPADNSRYGYGSNRAQP